MIADADLHDFDKTNVAQKVTGLAIEHDISDSMTNIDYVANKFAELSGNRVYEDSIMRLCIMLSRHKVVTKSAAMKLIHLHLSSK